MIADEAVQKDDSSARRKKEALGNAIGKEERGVIRMELLSGVWVGGLKLSEELPFLMAEEGWLLLQYCQVGLSEGRNPRSPVRAGDLRITSGWGRLGEAGSWAEGSRGIAVWLDHERVKKGIQEVFPWLPVSMETLWKKYGGGNLLVLRQEMVIQRIFEDLFCYRRVSQGSVERWQGYLRLKLAELFVYLEECSLEQDTEQREEGELYYVSRSMVERVKRLRLDFCRQPELRRTAAELAEEYGFSETMLKKCFRAVYGQTLGSYRRQYRMELAAKRLLEEKSTILDIAMSVGYENPGKFAAAFRQQYGVSPTEYRREHPEAGLSEKTKTEMDLSDRNGLDSSKKV